MLPTELYVPVLNVSGSHEAAERCSDSVLFGGRLLEALRLSYLRRVKHYPGIGRKEGGRLRERGVRDDLALGSFDFPFV